jgi:hypothetical protein
LIRWFVSFYAVMLEQMQQYSIAYRDFHLVLLNDVVELKVLFQQYYTKSIMIPNVIYKTLYISSI